VDVEWACLHWHDPPFSGGQWKLSPLADQNRYAVSGGDTLVPMERMSPGELQLKQVLLADKIELAIMMFESETASIVSAIAVNRSADGRADVSVNISPR
jgi:hypothetical protein